ncbi:MAG TPA: Uma2 family endonuclease [Leptospiraceae bacterium]|nr:Uma2 family endonuclease [Leptospiraceae bacterium]
MENHARKLYTEEEYLALERKAEFKSEYFAGEIFMMAGAKERHNLITWNLLSELHSVFKNKPCKAYPSDMRVRVADNGLYTYPDISIVCDKAEFLDENTDTLLNPIVLIEVLSESTESNDRGKKFEFYRTIPSLKEYILVSTTHQKIEKYKRNQNSWILTESEIGKPFPIESIECTLRLEDVYAKVEWNEIKKII